MMDTCGTGHSPKESIWQGCAGASLSLVILQRSALGTTKSGSRFADAMTVSQQRLFFYLQTRFWSEL